MKTLNRRTHVAPGNPGSKKADRQSAAVLRAEHVAFNATRPRHLHKPVAMDKLVLAVRARRKTTNGEPR